MLTTQEKDLIIKLLQDGHEIPHYYKTKIFPNEDKYVRLTKEYKVTYDGKSSKAEVLTDTLPAPLQEARVFNEDNQPQDGWRNKLIFGDNLMALKTIYDDLKPDGQNKLGLRNKIRLIYIDPPFASSRDFMKDKEKAYQDKVVGAQFIEFLRKRLIFLREILADDGTIFVHLDYKKGHYIKAIMDEIFGEHNFRNEIIWQKIRSVKAQGVSFGSVHDTIFAYSKTDQPYFRRVGVEQDPNYYKKFDKVDPETGRKYQLVSLLQKGSGPARRFGEVELHPGQGRHWIWSQEKIDEAMRTGLIEMTSGGKPRKRQYLDESNERVADDLWTDIYPVNSQAKEDTKYPTQKPEKLLERIILASTQEDDLVLDAFAGAGTSLAVAEKLGRRWIGMDCGKLSIYTIQKRLLSLNNIIGTEKKDERILTERVPNIDSHFKNSRGLFIVTEKARNGELEITDAFFNALHNLLLKVPRLDTFSIVCPENKFNLEEHMVEEGEDEEKIIVKDGITYKVSFVEAKAKVEKAKPLKAKTFALYNAGIYDEKDILSLRWDEYRQFVLNLFQVREKIHTINGFRVDGYIGVYPTYIWEYPNKKDITIDLEYVKTLHASLNGKAGDKLYFIAPSNSYAFIEDEIELGDTTYVFYKVPNSILAKLIEKGELSSFKQPKSVDDVNDIIDSIGFDFISQPEISYECFKYSDNTLLEEENFIIRLNEFKSNGLLYSPEDFENFETLSMILIQYNFEEEPFIMDHTLWAKDLIIDGQDFVDIPIDLTKWIEGKLAVILLDIYGNEKRLVFSKEEFINVAGNQK